ncbi:hypothetical protein [Streptomyces sp. NBC_00271]|uniref:hypothetical protein n=1 Tax=Streptomyces sp. NBC_00271 TaxID=2975697 RepID=UPI002E2C3A74|nr:hypothetical protein [Streptomyces sp. NBC_00271]
MTGRAGKFVALTWDDAGLSDLHAQPAHEMPGRVTAFAIEQEVRLVRGVVNAPDRRGVGRVVLWDGQQLDSSVAFDLPLTDAYGANIPPGDLAAALRDVLADCPEREVGEESRDAFGIPVIDASAAVHDFVGRPRFHLSDALQAAAAAFARRDDEGSVVVGVTGTHAVLPILLETGELERMRKNADDPYCRAVYDLADWLTGR